MFDAIFKTLDATNPHPCGQFDCWDTFKELEEKAEEE